MRRTHSIAAARRTSASVARAIATIAGLAVAGAALHAHALDLASLDRVSVMMSMDQVRAIAGPPAEMRAVTPELTLAMWTMNDVPGMHAAGGIFDARGALIAQAYVFAGSLGDQVLERMRALGFKATTGADGVIRLYGPDDNTGRPLVAVIDDRGETTTLFAYDQGEYERRSSKPGAMPASDAIATAPLIDPRAPAGAPASGGMDPAVRGALMNGIGLMGGMKPMQKSTTLSSSSSTTRNADGSITTRSSSVKASVGVDPAGVANALMQLMK